MTQEEKARRYDEAIEIARQYYNDRVMPIGTNFKLERIFPELHESEDERIRKELIEFVKNRGGFKREYIVWLEKRKSTVDINDVCKWLKKYAKCYVNGEYNDYHNCVEYDGTIDVDLMIERIKYNFG